MLKVLYKEPQRGISSLGFVLLGLTLLTSFHWYFYPGYRLPLVYAVIFHIVLYRPDLMKISLLIPIGFVQDCLINAPLGVSVGEMWLVWWLSLSQRYSLAKKGFWIVWFRFMLISGLVFILRAMFAFYFMEIIPKVKLLLYDWGITVLLYPWLSLIMSSLQKRLEDVS